MLDSSVQTKLKTRKIEVEPRFSCLSATKRKCVASYKEATLWRSESKHSWRRFFNV